MTHGALGESLLDCASHVLGKLPDQLACLAVSSHDDPGAMVSKALASVAALNTGEGVLVLTDIYGATPCNIVAKVLKPGTVEAVAGVNLPMLLRTLTYRAGSLPSLIEKAVSGGREGVIAFTSESCERYEPSASTH